MRPSEAIKIIKRLIESVELVYKSNPLTDKEPHPETDALTLAVSALEKQEQDRWIPVTERLPEKPGWCAITVHYEAIPEDEDGPEIPEKWETGVAYWDWVYPNDPTKKERGKWWVNAYDYDGYITSADCITAWRPLPEAFETEEVCD